MFVIFLPFRLTQFVGVGLGGGCRGCTPSPLRYCLLLRTTQLCCSIVVHPLQRKILDLPLAYIVKGALIQQKNWAEVSRRAQNVSLVPFSINYLSSFYQNNSAGLLCNECERGFFFLTSINPEGCTNCVCMGITANCSSTMHYQTQVNEDEASILCRKKDYNVTSTGTNIAEIWLGTLLARALLIL